MLSFGVAIPNLSFKEMTVEGTNVIRICLCLAIASVDNLAVSPNFLL
jgi:hypothetical protein